MTDLSRAAITVENLSKAYHIGLRENRADTLVGALQGLARAPLKNFRRLARMNTFRHCDESDDIFWALKDVSFEVAEGEVVGIIGRNGAGKSTLLKILSRITEPTSGRAVIRGRVSSLLEVGTGFHQELTGRENVYMNGTILGMTKREIDQKFDEIVDFSGVEKFLDTPIKHYSSGMKVRLAFAVAAHLEPEILIIDEVLAVGDAEFQKKCLGKMKDVARDGRTVLFVSHNMGAITSLCTTAMIVSSGQISDWMPARAAVGKYLSSFGSNEGSGISNNTRDMLHGGPPIVQSIRLSNGGDGSAFVEAGGQVTCEIVLRPNKIRNGSCGLIVLDEDGQRVVAFHTSYQSALLIQPSDHLVNLTCEIPSLPIVPGKYFIDLAVASDNEIVERITHAHSFEVTYTDYFGTGQMPKKGQGFLLLDCMWNIERSDASLTYRG